MKYLKVLENESALQAFKNGSEYVEPNICYLKDVGGIRWKAWEPVMAGDVAYWDGYRVKTTPFSEWDASLGTPVGVVVVPKGFAPDGRPRIVNLYWIDASGNTTTSFWNAVKVKWANVSVDTSLTNYQQVPTTDNAGSTSTGSNYNGYLPSDNFTGATSFVDPKAKYIGSSYTPMIPSPYKGEGPNPEYYKEILLEGNTSNALSDFNGLSNTETLVGLGADYVAANVAWKYKDGASNLQWYLPAMGELGYIMPRLKEINSVITALGGAPCEWVLWSSTERFSYANFLSLNDGRVFDYGNGGKSSTLKFRPFAIL